MTFFPFEWQNFLVGAVTRIGVVGAVVLGVVGVSTASRLLIDKSCGPGRCLATDIVPAWGQHVGSRCEC